jgi:hypothetical protein
MFIIGGEEIMERITYMAIWFRRTLTLNRGWGLEAMCHLGLFMLFGLCVWTMIVVGANMVVHDITYNISHFLFVSYQCTLYESWMVNGNNIFLHSLSNNNGGFNCYFHYLLITKNVTNP